MKTKIKNEVKEVRCCEECGVVRGDNVSLSSIKTWKGYVTMCEDCYSMYMSEKADKQKLYAYICLKQGLSAPTPVIYGQVKKLVSQGYSHKQIQYFVYYVHNISKNYNTKYSHCINTVEWGVDEAIEYAEANNLDLDTIIY